MDSDVDSNDSGAPSEDLGIDMNEGTQQSQDSSKQGNDANQGSYRFDVVEADKVAQYMSEIIGEVANVIQIPPTTARTLLNYFKWDKEKLMERYYDGDQEKLLKDAHISPITGASRGNAAAAAAAKTKPETCPICLAECPTTAMAGLECGHRFCVACWSQYLTTKIMDQGMGQTISCAAHGCGRILNDELVMKLLTDEKVKTRYQQLIANNFVECNRLIRWCPSTDCTNAVRVVYADAKPVRCKCGFEFCFGCGYQWHDPVSCDILKKWVKKCNDDSETSNYIAANTKECPKCHSTVEKDGGCNHMTCKNCKFQYCWLCMGPWEPHGSSWYNCNRFDDANAKAARDAQEKSRAALQRYLHYCNRYMNHMQSLKFESTLYARVKTKMDEMQLYGMSWIEVQFLRKAVDVLCECRRTLMFTYAFAYYLKKNNQTIIFETNQQDLELATEQLSEFLERDLAKANLATLKQNVQDKYKYCEQRRMKLIDHCHEGDDKDWWEFMDNPDPAPSAPKKK